MQSSIPTTSTVLHHDGNPVCYSATSQAATTIGRYPPVASCPNPVHLQLLCHRIHRHAAHPDGAHSEFSKSAAPCCTSNHPPVYDSGHGCHFAQLPNHSSWFSIRLSSLGSSHATTGADQHGSIRTRSNTLPTAAIPSTTHSTASDHTWAPSVFTSNKLLCWGGGGGGSWASSFVLQLSLKFSSTTEPAAGRTAKAKWRAGQHGAQPQREPPWAACQWGESTLNMVKLLPSHIRRGFDRRDLQSEGVTVHLFSPAWQPQRFWKSRCTVYFQRAAWLAPARGCQVRNWLQRIWVRLPGIWIWL